MPRNRDTPAFVCGVKGFCTLVVTSGGSGVPLPHHIKNSTLPNVSKQWQHWLQQPQQPSAQQVSSAYSLGAASTVGP